MSYGKERKDMIDGPRGLMPDELDKLLEELVNVVYSPNMRGSFPTLFCEENAEHLRIIKADGKFVSHVGIVVRDIILNGCRISVGNVGAVGTHEDYRKRGYAWSIFEDAMGKFRAEGVDMFLVSGFRSLYHLHGCTHVGRVARYHVTRDMELPEPENARPFSPDDLPAWAALHRAEPVRFHRPYEDFQKLTAIMPAHRGRSLYSIWRGDSIAAYAVLVRSRDKSVHLDEYAGSRRALLGAVETWCEKFDVPGIGIAVPMHDVEFSGLLDSIGAKATYASTGGTITVLHFPRLCRKLKPMFEEIVGREIAQGLIFGERDGLYVIGLDNDEVVLDDAHDVARLVFGNPAGRDEQTEISAQGKLREVLEAIFPIPRPEYGLSFI
jgi:GNAT superfamily N-acetyltransferase